MKNKKLLAIFPALGLLLSGCSFEDLMFWKKKDSQGDNTPAQTGVSLDDIVSKLKPIAASTLGKSESELVGVDYTSESEEGDYYTYNKDGLMFAGFYTWQEDEDMGLDASEIYESLVGKLPSGSAIDNEKSEISEDDGYYCAVYASGDYYYVVYVYDYYALGMIVEYSIDIVPKTQFDAYYELVFSGGEGEDEDEDEDEDDPAFVTAFNEAVASYNIELGLNYYGYYSDVVYTGESTDTKAGESVLKGAADSVKAVLPESVVGSSDAGTFYSSEEDYWEDNSGDTAYVYEYENIPNDSGAFRLTSYVYNGYITVQLAYFPGE